MPAPAPPTATRAHPAPSEPTPARAWALSLTSAAAAGTGAVVGKWGVDATSRPVFLAWLFAFGTLFAATITTWRPPRDGRRLSLRGLGLLLVHALLACLGCWGWYEGLVHLDAAAATFVGRADVLITVGLSIVVLGERLRWLEVLGGAVGIVGLVLMGLPAAGQAPHHLDGVLLVLLGCVGFGLSELLAKRSVGEVDPGTFVVLRSALMATTFVLAALAGDAPLVAPPRALLAAAGVALLGPVVARLLYMQALHLISLSRASLIAQTQPLFATLVAFLALGTLPSRLEWFGGGLLVLGSALVVWGARPRAPRGD